MWFKRDLRVENNFALQQAVQEPCIPLYIIEPELWRQGDMSTRHYIFLKSCLLDLDKALQAYGQRLIIKVGHCEEVFLSLIKQFAIKAVWSHQETGNHWTYQRDIRIKKLFQYFNVSWHEPVQNAVVRNLKTRDQWDRLRKQFFNRSEIHRDIKLEFLELSSDPLPSFSQLSLLNDTGSFQKGGRKQGLKCMADFLNFALVNYSSGISSPNSAWKICSRLSPHLTFGTLSVKEVLSSIQQKSQELHNYPCKNQRYWLRSLKAFSSRMAWRCHFIQKLESEPAIEFQNIHPAFDELRQYNEDYFYAWREGKTGYPLVDACMRSLKATGWLNFRMRAMVTSFACYHLWLDWPKIAEYLATLFVDYEPGIHYPQIQMQAGTTGINTLRIYNPYKQALEQDPNAHFIRRWLPEIRHCSTALIHSTWLSTKVKSYPQPIVEEVSARRQATDALYTVKKKIGFNKIKSKIVKKHASRKSLRKNARNGRKSNPDTQQMELEL